MPKEIRQPEQKLNSEPQPIDTTSCPNIGNTHVVCSQSRVSSLSDMKKVWLSDEYLKKRFQSYKAMRKIICQKINIDKFKVFLKADS